jgi:hypothetical protein
MLRKLFKGNNEEERQTTTEEIEAPPCPHTAIVARWDSVEDMGKDDKVSAYFCQGCNQVFTPEEAQPYLA